MVYIPDILHNMFFYHLSFNPLPLAFRWCVSLAAFISSSHRDVGWMGSVLPFRSLLLYSRTECSVPTDAIESRIGINHQSLAMRSAFGQNPNMVVLFGREDLGLMNRKASTAGSDTSALTTPTSASNTMGISGSSWPGCEGKNRAHNNWTRKRRTG